MPAQKNEEFGLLACIARNNDVLAQCEITGLQAPDFQNSLYRYIYSIMLMLYTSNKKIDEVTLRTSSNQDALANMLYEEQLSSKQFFDSLFSSAVSLDNAEMFISRIMDSSLTKAINGSLDQLNDSRASLPSAELITKMEDVLQFAYTRMSLEAPTVIGGNSKLFDLIANRPKVQIAGLATPWPTINMKLSGLPAGSLTMWVAGTGVGKTNAMVNLANKISVTDKIAGLVIGSEMSYEEMMLRLVSCRSGIKERDLRLNANWHMAQQSVDKVRKACHDIDGTDTFHYLCMPDFTISKIRGHAIRMKMRYNIQYLIFDYVSEPEDADTGRRQEWQNLSNFVWRLKGLARQLNIAVIFTAQTTLSGSAERIFLTDIAMARYMSFHCDHIIGVVNKKNSTLTAEKQLGVPGLGNQKAYILKGRHGGEDHGGESTARYINFEQNRDVILVKEGVYPPVQGQSTE